MVYVKAISQLLGNVFIVDSQSEEQSEMAASRIAGYNEFIAFKAKLLDVREDVIYAFRAFINLLFRILVAIVWMVIDGDEIKTVFDEFGSEKEILFSIPKDIGTPVDIDYTASFLLTFSID